MTGHKKEKERRMEVYGERRCEEGRWIGSR